MLSTVAFAISQAENHAVPATAPADFQAGFFAGSTGYITSDSLHACMKLD